MREERTLRSRQAESDVELDRLDESPPIPPRPILCQTKTVGTYPTTAKSFYAVNVIDPDGTEAEGSSGSFSATTGTRFALNGGTQIPPSGTYILCEELNGRLTFVYG